MPVLLQPSCAVPKGIWSHNGRALRQPALFGLGGDVHHIRAAQQHAEPVRPSLLHRHFRRVPLVAVGWLRGRPAADQAPDHYVPRPWAAQRGDMDRRDDQRLCSVYVQRGLRQGHRNRRAHVSVRCVSVRADDGRQPARLHRPRRRALLRPIDLPGACCCTSGRPDLRHVDPHATRPSGESALAAEARRTGMSPAVSAASSCARIGRPFARELVVRGGRRKNQNV